MGKHIRRSEAVPPDPRSTLLVRPQSLTVLAGTASMLLPWLGVLVLGTLLTARQASVSPLGVIVVATMVALGTAVLVAVVVRVVRQRLEVGPDLVVWRSALGGERSFSVSEVSSKVDFSSAPGGPRRASIPRAFVLLDAQNRRLLWLSTWAWTDEDLNAISARFPVPAFETRGPRGSTDVMRLPKRDENVVERHPLAFTIGAGAVLIVAASIFTAVTRA